MKARAIVGLVTGALMVLSALAHGLLGWPAMRAGLDGLGSSAELSGALAVGWHFGSVAMLVFAAIVLPAAWRSLRGRAVDRWPVGAIAVGYLVFGLVAFLARDLNPHFLLFVATGALLAVYGFGRG